MTELKFFRGESERIGENTTPIVDGSCYFCVDNGKLYFDFSDGNTSKRFCINGVNEYQGVENYGKLLSINEQGYITPSSIVVPTGKYKWQDFLTKFTWGFIYGDIE